MRLEITDDCCATARMLIAKGLDPNELLEFCRGPVVSLRGTARAFASRRVLETERIGPVFVRWTPLDPERKVRLRSRHQRQHALKPLPLSGT
jgi:hypothetical protein